MRRPIVPTRQEEEGRSEAWWRGKGEMDLDCAMAQQEDRRARMFNDPRYG